MKVLYLIGNGLDLAYRLKTSYSDFYKSFIKDKEGDTEEIKKLKKRIQSDYATWADLEKAIGEDTVNFDTEIIFEDTFYKIKDELQDYLLGIDQSFSPSSGLMNKAMSSIINPKSLLEEADLVLFNSFANRMATPVFIDIVTFNYTYTLEKLLGNKFPIEISGYHIRRPRHIHGVLDDTILMGVNDNSQLANDSFRYDENLQDIIVKPIANDAMRNLSNVEVEKLIKEANLIILYGLSLGETDRKWWNLIGKQYSRDDFKLMYFYVNKNAVPPRRSEQKLRVYRQCIQYIINTFGIADTLQNQVQSKTLIAINKPLFGSI